MVGKNTVEYSRALKKNASKVSIPAAVKINGITYKVASISANAFKGSKKLKKVAIGGNVSKIGKNAFYGCRNLKSVVIKTKKLTSKNVGRKAFEGINAKAKIKVPSSRLKAYKKILKAKGLPAKAKVVK